jgi:hypothetical protein
VVVAEEELEFAQLQLHVSEANNQELGLMAKNLYK